MDQRDGEDKREKILEAALRLFNAAGFDRTPTSAITKEAGVATGTLFHYFGTKEDLVNALYLRCKDSLIASALIGVDEARPYRERFEVVYTNLLRWVIGHRDEFLFFRQFSSSPHIAAATKSEGRSRFGPIVACLSEGAETDTFKDAPIAYLFDLIAAHLMVAAEYLLAHPEAGEGFPLLSFALLWDGLKKENGG